MNNDWQKPGGLLVLYIGPIVNAGIGYLKGNYWTNGFSMFIGSWFCDDHVEAAGVYYETKAGLIISIESMSPSRDTRFFLDISFGIKNDFYPAPYLEYNTWYTESGPFYFFQMNMGGNKK